VVYFTERYLPLFVSVPWGPWEKGLDSQRYGDALRRLVVRDEPYVFLSEARWAALPDAAARKDIAEMTNTLDELTKDMNVASVAVLASRLQVGAATAVAWLTRRKSNVVYMSSASEGLERLHQAATSRGLVLPTEAVSACRAFDRLAASGTMPPLEELKELL
jgi:hypothetical protein